MEVGIFGGTFDPPHIGHLVAAREARERLGLERVRFIPARRSPFKGGDVAGSPAEVRFAMLRRAIHGDPAFEASRIEIDRDPPSYTIDTLRLLAAREPEVRWTLLIGADQWASFSDWREPEQIARHARIAVFRRAGRDPAEIEPGVDVPWTPVSIPRLDISSSRLRERIAEGRGVRYLVPDAVREFIESKELYAPC